MSLRRIFWLCDCCVLVLAFLSTHAWAPHARFAVAASNAVEAKWLNDSDGYRLSLAQDSLPLLLIFTLAAILLMDVVGGNVMPGRLSTAQLWARSLFAVTGSVILAVPALPARAGMGADHSPTLAFLILGGLGLLLYRLAMHAYFRGRLADRAYAKNALLVGPAPAMEPMADYFQQNVSPREYRLVGYLSVSTSQGALAGTPPSHAYGERKAWPRLGMVADLATIAFRYSIHEVIAVETAGSESWMRQVVEDCRDFQLVLRVIPEALCRMDLEGALRQSPTLARQPGRSGDSRGHRLGTPTLSALENTPSGTRPASQPDGFDVPAITLDLRRVDSRALFIKRLFDVVASACFLVLLSPLLLIVAVLIKLNSPGPVFFNAECVGLRGQPFTMYKFRTMVADARARLANLQMLNRGGPQLIKIKNDPRVTALGKILRRYSLDELPQLLNVLRGEMSLVGPRPQYPSEAAHYTKQQARRLIVRPGITGLLQVSPFRNNPDFNHWVRLDLNYIDHWSLWLDIRILWRTIGVVIAGGGQ